MKHAGLPSIRLFSENFEVIFEQLGLLALEANGKTHQDAYQFRCAANSTIFVICLLIISYYSSRLESVAQALQSTQLDILKVYDHVQELLKVFRGHRENADNFFKQS